MRLIVVIVPGKQTIYPEGLTGRYRPAWGPATNRDMPRFLAEMRRHGVEIIDATDVLWQARESAATYLRLDTHWTPQGMALVADEVAKSLPGLARSEARFEVEEQEVRHHGDLYDMLGLAPGLPALLPEETVTVQRVVDADTGLPLEPDTTAPVTLLGDSFTNIYSVDWMGWGDHAGLGEQIGLRLGMPVDIIALNDGGVNTARATLARRPDPLDGKQVVIWQFAARDLVVSNGQWQNIEIPPRRP